VSAWTLLLRLEGPMQSWGTGSRFDDRGTGLEPSKSGVIGLLCAAMGVSRRDDATVAALAALEMLVRVDRQGTLRTDFVTIGGGRWRGRRYGAARASGGTPGPAVSRRAYLADASFLVGLGGRDAALLWRAARGLASPVWPLSLGRKSYVPSAPIGVRAEPVAGRPWEAIARTPWGPGDEQRRLVVEVAPDGGGVPRDDVPLSFGRGERLYGRRYVRDVLLGAAPGQGAVLIPRGLPR